MSTVSLAEIKSEIFSLMRQQQHQQATEQLSQVTPANRTEQMEILEIQALCYFQLQQYDRAAEFYQLLAEEDPQSAKPLINLGAVYNRQKKYDQAVQSLRKAIQRDKQNVDAYFNLGFAQRHAGHSDLAIAAYKEALHINSQLEHVHLNIANAYLDVNNTVMAINHYRTALTLNSELDAAQRGLDKAYEKEQANKSLNNPFGRLVDMSQLSHQKAATAMKALSEADREKDREEVTKFAKGIRNAGRHLSEQLREKMQPALLALTRALIDGEQHPGHIAQSHSKYQQELPRFHEAFRYLKRSVLELRGHEEILNTPDLDGLF